MQKVLGRRELPVHIPQKTTGKWYSNELMEIYLRWLFGRFFTRPKRLRDGVHKPDDRN
jgi:hypothetical protein